MESINEAFPSYIHQQQHHHIFFLNKHILEIDEIWNKYYVELSPEKQLEMVRGIDFNYVKNREHIFYNYIKNKKIALIGPSNTKTANTKEYDIIVHIKRGSINTDVLIITGNLNESLAIFNSIPKNHNIKFILCIEPDNHSRIVNSFRMMDFINDNNPPHTGIFSDKKIHLAFIGNISNIESCDLFKNNLDLFYPSQLFRKIPEDLKMDYKIYSETFTGNKAIYIFLNCLDVSKLFISGFTFYAETLCTTMQVCKDTLYSKEYFDLNLKNYGKMNRKNNINILDPLSSDNIQSAKKWLDYFLKNRKHWKDILVFDDFIKGLVIGYELWHGHKNTQ